MTRDELLNLLKSDQEVRDAIFKHNTEAEVRQAQELHEKLSRGVVRSVEDGLKIIEARNG